MNLELATKRLEIKTGPLTRIDGLDETGPLSEVLDKYLQNDALLVIWQRQRLIWGHIQAGRIRLSDNSDLEENQVLELRAFNEKEELHLLRQQGHYLGRYLKEGVGSKTDYVDSLSRFWGTCVGLQDGFAQLQDAERFLHLTIPVTENAAYYGLVTRNYIGVDEATGQAGYSDYRFLRIEAAERGK